MEGGRVSAREGAWNRRRDRERKEVASRIRRSVVVVLITRHSYRMCWEADQEGGIYEQVASNMGGPMDGCGNMQRTFSFTWGSDFTVKVTQDGHQQALEARYEKARTIQVACRPAPG